MCPFPPCHKLLLTGHRTLYNCVCFKAFNNNRGLTTFIFPSPSSLSFFHTLRNFPNSISLSLSVTLKVTSVTGWWPLCSTSSRVNGDESRNTLYILQDAPYPWPLTPTPFYDPSTATQLSTPFPTHAEADEYARSRTHTHTVNSWDKPSETNYFFTTVSACVVYQIPIKHTLIIVSSAQDSLTWPGHR